MDNFGKYFVQKTGSYPSKHGVAIKKPVDFNFNKLVAVLCITASAATSVVVIAWSVQTYL